MSNEREMETLAQFLVEHEICTKDEYMLVITISGYTLNTINGILYARTGYRNLEQLQGALDD